MSFYSKNIKRVSVILITFLIVLTAFLYAYARLKSPVQDKKQLLTMIMDGINEVHYSPQPVDDAFSNKIFTEFLKRVDNNKKFFTQSDVAELSRYKNSIDDEINTGSTDFFAAVMLIYNKRFEQAYRYSKAHLDTPFNFNKDESIETNEDKLIFSADTIAMEDVWRKYMKLQVLQQLYDATEKQTKAKEKSDTVKIKSFAELEADARVKVKKNNEDFFKRVRELDETDWYSVYLNCISNIEDPHTEYFPPVDKQNFDIQISGQLEGIGAQLQQKDGDIKIMSIVAGSASWRQGQLKAGDAIIKVGQGAQEPVNVEGMRLDKAIQLIRGKKGTEVRITVRKPDGSILTAPIIRDVVILESTYAQSFTINNGGEKIGYIRLPEFYTPIGQQGGRGCADDVKKELQKLQAENVDGVILDLRDNGGGSLQEAVKLGGLFISTGPIVLVKPRGTKSNALNDYDPAIVYGGPLVVMVNENSASASEITAAALQDYHRAVIVGSNTTYGKGTVQNFYNLDDFVPKEQGKEPSLGSIKITIQKYYRINGGTTQLNGVTSDIVLPDAYSEIADREKDDPNALGWDEIPAAKYEIVKPTYSISNLKSKSEKRVNNNSSFQLIKQEAFDFKVRTDFSIYPLNFDKFSALKKEWDVNEKKYEAISADSNLVNISNLAVDLPKINSDSTAIARNNQFIKNLKKDIYINEVSQIVGEMK